MIAAYTFLVAPPHPNAGSLKPNQAPDGNGKANIVDPMTEIELAVLGELQKAAVDSPGLQKAVKVIEQRVGPDALNISPIGATSAAAFVSTSLSTRKG